MKAIVYETRYGERVLEVKSEKYTRTKTTKYLVY